MTVVFENNIICSDESIQRALLDRHANLKNLCDSKGELCLIRLHTEDEIVGTERVDLTGWKELSREMNWSSDRVRYNYSIIHFGRRETPLQMSVVLSTCNQPAWLEKVLWGYEAQISKDFELIVADDGSRKETYDMLQKIIPHLSFRVKHVWHEDKGFRKCDILNKGILAAQTNYLLFSDGDCIPRPDFVSTHLKLRRKGRFLSGGYHKLTIDLSKLITKEDVLTGRIFDLQWLRSNGMAASFKNNKLTADGFRRWALNTFTPTKASWNGHNASGWLSDILAVNGFDERMQYGGQDREFGERLENYGVHGMQIRYSTVCLHLDHSRGYRTKESIQKNVDIRKNTRGKHVQWSPNGLVKDPLYGRMVAINSFYDCYTREEEKLTAYKQRGGFYRHLYSLPCRLRRQRCVAAVLRGYQEEKNSPMLSNRSGVIVSLTTFPPRLSQLPLMLKSILWQTCPPEKIVVWLSEEEFPERKNNLSAELTALIEYGVDFRFVPGNLRSHKKYYYVFREYPDKEIITVDDDLIYPRNTIERLLNLSSSHPNTVCGNVIRHIKIKNKSFAAYKEWVKVAAVPVTSSLQNVAIGCGGIYYPPYWYDADLFDCQIFNQRCPSADDLWLKANELKNQIKVTGGGAFFPRPIELPHTQNNSLQKKNNGSVNLNDKQWLELNALWKLDEIYFTKSETRDV